MEIFLANWRLAAVAALFFVGIVSRRAGVAGEQQGRALLAFVFNVGLPILIFGALAGVELRREHALLPVAAICVSLAGWGAAAIVARRFGLPRTGEGAMVMCAMSLNNSMIYPFAALSLGAAAFSQLVAFDMGHALLVWTVTTVIACKYGGHADDIPVLLKRTLLAPPLWVLFISLALNVGSAPIPRNVLHAVLLVGQFAILAVPLAMGLLVSARGLRRPEVITAVALRSGFGVLVGLALVWLFGLGGSGAAIAIIGSAAPIGFTAVVLSSREGLDLDLAASAAAVSVFLGSIWIPLAMFFVPR
ncbi:MAG TPA: AEC family transporter [Steroidobacteraceae bacterium]|nr:AEC family transporter [Steroidobacteraceae bacterium]